MRERESSCDLKIAKYHYSNKTYMKSLANSRVEDKQALQNMIFKDCKSAR